MPKVTFSAMSTWRWSRSGVLDLFRGAGLLPPAREHARRLSAGNRGRHGSIRPAAVPAAEGQDLHAAAWPRRGDRALRAAAAPTSPHGRADGCAAAPMRRPATRWPTASVRHPGRRAATSPNSTARHSPRSCRCARRPAFHVAAATRPARPAGRRPATAQIVGTITDLWIDRAEQLVRYLEIDADGATAADAAGADDDGARSIRRDGSAEIKSHLRRPVRRGAATRRARRR